MSLLLRQNKLSINIFGHGGNKNGNKKGLDNKINLGYDKTEE